MCHPTEDRLEPNHLRHPRRRPGPPPPLTPPEVGNGLTATRRGRPRQPGDFTPRPTQLEPCVMVVAGQSGVEGVGAGGLQLQPGTYRRKPR